ncbi:MAG: hypothetical protein Q7R85_01995 [bacterium]|nr:hypothetical protein [bacterium]
MKIKVKVVPTQGKSTTKDVEVEESGASVAEVCEAAGIDVKNMDLTMNGKPAKLTTHVGPKDALEAKDKPVVAVSERPRGS